MFTKKTIRDIDINGKTVLMRADYNVPLENGRITDDYRIKASLPTLNYLLEHNARIIICSHLGRPDGKPNQVESLEPAAKRLGELLPNVLVSFAHDCVGVEASQAAKALQPGSILVLENLRFHPEEEANDAQFAKQLAALADVFVQDGFAVVHRAHASTEAVTHFLPSIAGLLLEREVDTITSVMENPERPLMAVVGGAKISDKIEVLHRFIEIADVVVVGGAMANTFLAAQGVDVAMSLVERDAINVAQEVIVSAKKRAKEGHFIFALPVDGVVATEISVTATTRIVGWKEHSIAAIENYPKQPPQRAMQLESGERILDIGPCSASFFAGLMQLVNTVVWNGTMGVTETKGLGGSPGPFARGTELIVEAMLGNLGHRPFSVVGGGDTVGYIEQRQLAGSFDHVSTGGGASLELMSGRKLPGVEALEDR